MTENEISFKIREQYSKFTHPGPGLFESVYESALYMN
jgi:hypothetical protein